MSQSLRSQFAKLIVNQRQQLLRRVRIAAIDGRCDSPDFVHESHHASRTAIVPESIAEGSGVLIESIALMRFWRYLKQKWTSEGKEGTGQNGPQPSKLSFPCSHSCRGSRCAPNFGVDDALGSQTEDRYRPLTLTILALPFS